MFLFYKYQTSYLKRMINYCLIILFLLMAYDPGLDL